MTCDRRTEIYLMFTKHNYGRAAGAGGRVGGERKDSINIIDSTTSYNIRKEERNYEYLRVRPRKNDHHSKHPVNQLCNPGIAY